MKLFSKLAVTVALLSAACVGARADTTVLNTDLATPPGVYYGSGNPNGQWTVTNSGGTNPTGIELGLRAHIRFGANITPDGNVYSAPAGSSGGRALWNFDYSVNLGSTGLLLSDFNAGGTTLTITDLTVPSTRTIDPFSIADTPTYNQTSATVHPHSTGTPFSPNGLGDTAFQNSENLTFGEFIIPGFDPDARHVYQFTLNLVGDTGSAAAGVNVSDTIFVNTAPLPSVSSMGLTMLAVVGAAALARKKVLAPKTV